MSGKNLRKCLVFPDSFQRTGMKTLNKVPKRRPHRFLRKHGLQCVLCGLAPAVVATGFFRPAVKAQQSDAATPVVVQPGAPGKPSRRLPPSTSGKLPPKSQAEVEFMQGMIMHHA